MFYHGGLQNEIYHNFRDVKLQRTTMTFFFLRGLRHIFLPENYFVCIDSRCTLGITKRLEFSKEVQSIVLYESRKLDSCSYLQSFGKQIS